MHPTILAPAYKNLLPYSGDTVATFDMDKRKGFNFSERVKSDFGADIA
jgi:hypothetical protein